MMKSLSLVFLYVYINLLTDSHPTHLVSYESVIFKCLSTSFFFFYGFFSIHLTYRLININRFHTFALRRCITAHYSQSAGCSLVSLFKYVQTSVKPTKAYVMASEASAVGAILPTFRTRLVFNLHKWLYVAHWLITRQPGFKSLTLEGMYCYWFNDKCKRGLVPPSLISSKKKLYFIIISSFKLR